MMALRRVLVKFSSTTYQSAQVLHLSKTGTAAGYLVVSRSLTTKNPSLRDQIIIESSKPRTPGVTIPEINRSSATPSQSDDSLEREKELYAEKREMTRFYSSGDYKNALQSALTLHDMVVNLYGKKNAVYASCLNNIALMQKNLGNNEAAIDRYIAALQIYEEVSGKLSISYASTLSNLGAIYKHMASTTKGMEKQQYLDRAEEALGDAYNLRVQLHGKIHRDTLTSSVMLASLVKQRNRDEEAISSLTETMHIAEEQFGPYDVLIATIQNNLGYMHKTRGKFDAAKECYERAVKIRSTTLGEKHPETIIAMHNHAECLLASGDDTGAHKLQQKILEITGGATPADHVTVSSESSPTKPESTKPMTAAMMPNDSNESIRPKPADIVKRSNITGGLPPFKPDMVPKEPPITYKSRNHIPASRKKK